MKEKRDSLQYSEYMDKSKRVIEGLASLQELHRAKHIMLYVSANKEIFTHNLIKEMVKAKSVFVPVIEADEIKACALEKFNHLIPRRFGVLEPKIHSFIDPMELDIVVVPGLAFDRSGNRIGYGKGFYDVFLKKTSAFKAGLAFGFQIVEKIDAENHDVGMDIIVTEKEKILRSK